MGGVIISFLQEEININKKKKVCKKKKRSLWEKWGRRAQIIQFMILLSPLSVFIQTIYNFTQASVNETSSTNINNVMSITIFTLLKLTFILNCIGYLFSL